VQREGYLRDFAEFWSRRPEARKIWFSLFTPQEAEECEERLLAADRRRVIAELAEVAAAFPKVHMPRVVLDGYLRPPDSPSECIFARSTVCVSADLKTRVTPCQFGGKPVCSECGCMASSGLASIGRYELGGLIPVSALFSLSQKIGSLVGAEA
jgi:hypothetical protein